LSLAGLTACGDKVNVVQPVPDSTVTAVTVSPASVPMNVGDKITLVATVTAGAGQTNRNVTWSSGNAAVATVDATSGLVTAIGGGTTSIIAASAANPSVKGAAVVTVGAVIQPTVTISTINQTTAAGSVPATLSNISGQLDVTLNVDPGTQKLSTVALLMNCGGADTVVASQTLATANVAALSPEESTAPITLSFNTAAFNAASGVVAFKNGACTLKGRTTTTSGTIVASSGTPLTLNNLNLVSATFANTPSTGQVASATDANGLLWRAGSVTVTAIPVVYTNTTIVSASISLMNAGNDVAIGRSGAVIVPVNGGTAVATQTGLTPTAGVFSASFANSTTAPGVGGAVVDTLGVQVTTVDNNGNPGPTLNASSANFIRLDNRAPDITTTPPTFVAGTQNTANGWVGKAFLFSVAAGSLTGGSATADNQTAVSALVPPVGVTQNSPGGGGVDKVALNTQSAPQGTTTWTTFASVTSLAETPAATGPVAYDLRLQVCDALGNCANTGVLTTFGVDLTAPTATTAAGGPKANEIVGIGQTLSGGGTISVAASDPQGANLVAGSGFGASPVLASETKLAPVNPAPATDQATTCVIGTPLSPNTGCKSPAALPLSFAGVTTAPGQYALTYTVTDQAGNQSAPVSLNYYIDQAAPAMSGGIAIPASITSGSVFTASGVDDMDFASVNAVLTYPGNTFPSIVVAGTSSAAGVAFDNTLTRASTATVTLPTPFYRSLGTISGGAITVAQVKPTQIGIRGIDAANNLSTPDVGLFPATNISTPVTLVIGTDLTDFTVAVSPTTVSNGTGTVLPRSTTITATVTAVDANHGTPFGPVCFYIVNPSGAQGGLADLVTGAAAGELSLLGCTSVNTTTLVGTSKLITSTMSFDPDGKYGTASTLNIVAIGSTAAGDALQTGTAAGLTLVP
jgi:hypothetical protein